jgi:hypothetical protein
MTTLAAAQGQLETFAGVVGKVGNEPKRIGRQPDRREININGRTAPRTPDMARIVETAMGKPTESRTYPLSDTGNRLASDE